MMQREYDRLKTMIEDTLECFFKEELPQKTLFEAMRYSLLAGGKRIRPVMTLRFCESCGGEAKKALPFACAVEMIHTYSLIHDDLPCMDDDDLRRGKPTNHVVFGECNAVLAGDALQAAAFTLLSRAGLPAEAVVQALQVLGTAAGAYGMCGGQVLDMACEEKEAPTLEEIATVHEGKTAAMIKAAAVLGVLAGGGSEAQLLAAEKYAEALGLAFQIRDDVLDVVSTAEELGKPIGSDKESGKTTFAVLLGLEACDRLVREKTEEAKRAVTEAFEDPAFFCWLADSLAQRRN